MHTHTCRLAAACIHRYTVAEEELTGSALLAWPPERTCVA